MNSSNSATNSRQALFEDLYPRFDFPGGSLEWVSSDQTKVIWGTQEHLLNLDDFPNSNDLSSYDLIHWVYSNCDLLESELEDTYVFWDQPRGTFVAETVRGSDIVHRQDVSDPTRFPNYGNSSRFTFKLIGNILHISCLESGVSPLCVLSHPITSQEEVSRFFDIDEKMYMLSPLTHNSNKVFIGFKDSLERLMEDHEVEEFEMIPLKEWQDNINTRTRMMTENE